MDLKDLKLGENIKNSGIFNDWRENLYLKKLSIFGMDHRTVIIV